MKLRFVPSPGKGEHPPPLVHWPGMKATGQLYQYVGRKFDKDSRVHRSTGEPVEIESTGEYDVLARFRKACRQGDLLPYDKETASFCGVSFVELKPDRDNEWRPKASAAPEPKRTKSEPAFGKGDD